MTAADELVRARELVALRRQVWACLLDYPPFVDAILDHVGAELRELDPPTAELDQLRAAALSLRGRDTRETLDRYRSARDALVAVMHRHRAEAPLLRRLIAEVRAIAARQPATVLEVRTPPRGSRVFRSYVAELRQAEANLVRARQQFVAANLRLVVTMARRYHNEFLTPADLIQEGTLGLLRAVDGYDPDRGHRFSTYAAWWIKHGITRAVANTGLTVRVPANVLGLRTQLIRAEQAFGLEHGRSPTDAELAKLLEVPLKTLRNARRAVLGSVELTESGDWMVDPDTIDIEATLDQPVVLDTLAQVIEQLPGIEASVIRRRFALDGDSPLTLAEIGELHSLSRERIRQLEKQALGRLRVELRSRGVVAQA